ncbi:MAG: cysteine--tRNA ligase [Parcubacteria group bacterium]|nr:cysteine--tRNA ligase [Parcubacteria group bacterium]
MTIFLHNTLTRQKEEFKPLKRGAISMYHCGPTVYDAAHIGNLRSFVFADTLRRVMEYNGYAVKQVMNITDVDDKTIKRAAEERVPLSELTARYEKAFLSDADALLIKRPGTMPRATEHINEMVALIERLLERGLAYRGEDGSIYFDISKDPHYGELVNLEKQELKESVRVSSDEYSKEEPRDFVLWKAWQKSDGDIFWETSLGKGRPGWHIECSAMSMKYLGERFDIHTGGIDLAFPHHTNEIAQSGGHLANYWLHNEHLLVDGKKMAKSAGNFLTLKDITEKGFTPLALRYWFLQAHYRTPANFTWDALEAAQNALNKLYDHFYDTAETEDASVIPKAHFEEAVNDDLNTPLALAELWDVVRDRNLSGGVKRKIMLDFDRALGLGFAQLGEKHYIPDNVQALINKRAQARAEENWGYADELREKINKMGYKVEDTPDGQKVRPL